MQRVWLTLALLIASSSVAVLAGEMVVRWIAPQDVRLQTPGIYRMDSATVYALTPDHVGHFGNRVEYTTIVRTDGRGLRIPEGGPRSARPRRILMLGDSFVFGQGVQAEDALPLQLERALEQRGDSTTVLNGGVVGYATRQELAWYRRYGARLSPELVIVGAFLGNDLQDNRTSSLRRFNDGVVTAPTRRWHTPVTSWAYEHSHLYALVRRVPERVLERRRKGADDYYTGFLRKYAPPDDSVFREEVAVTAAAFAGLHAAVRASGADLLVALVPEAVQVEERRRAEVARVVPAGQPLDFEHPNTVFARMLDSLGIRWVDLTPAFRAAAGNGDLLYYPRDGHWTAAGNALAAGVLAEHIASRATDAGAR